MQARFSTPSSLAAHHRRLMASCAESGCPQVQQRSGAKSSARTVGESLCISKSVEAYDKGQMVSARDLPTGCQQQCSLVIPTVRATMSDRTERQVTSEAADEATGTRRSTRSASTSISLPARYMQHGRHRRHCSPGHHRTLPPWRDDHTAAGRPTQRLRNPTDGRSAQRSERRNLRLSDQWGAIAAATRSCSPELGLTAAPAAAR
jgi:hypothetical protein